MRILVVSQYFWPENFRVNEMVAYLASSGHDVTVLTGKPNYPDGVINSDFRASPEKFSNYRGARVVRVPMLARGHNKIQLAINYLSFALSGCTFGTARLAGQTFDVIFVCQLSPATAALPAVLQRRLKGAPLAMWVLDLWPESLSAVGGLSSKRGLDLIGKMVAFIYRRCDRIFVQSRSFVASVAARSGRDDNIMYFPAWAEVVFEGTGEAVELAPELALYGDTFNVMFAGNIGEAQDMPTVLAAAAILRHHAIRWLIVGDGRAAESVRAAIASENLGGTVFMLGRHPETRMPSFFVGADALLVCLKDDPIFAMTIPGKLQNYMRSGKPILAMLSGEGANVVSAAEAGVVTRPGDAVALADAVLRLASASAEERARMAENGRAYCQQEFDRATLFARLDGWLEDMVAAKNPNGAGYMPTELYRTLLASDLRSKKSKPATPDNGMQ
jgi:colanic acid biosynthesis glycosyl transferase WcaI